MNESKYPTPDRSNYSPHFHKNEDSDIDIGHNSGVTSDGRLFIAEIWVDEGMSIVTIFISAKIFGDYTVEELVKYVESEDIIRFFTEDKGLGADKFVDPSGSLLWSLNVTIGVDDEKYATTGFGIKRYNSN